MAAEIHRLSEAIALAETREAGGIIRTWYESIKATYGTEEAGVAFDVVQISRARGQCVTNIFEEGAVKNEINAGRDAVGIAQGEGNLVEIGDISSYSNYVEQSSISPELQCALIEGRRAIEGLAVSPDTIKELLANYGKLTIELQKPAPDKGMLTMFWSSIAAVASTAKPIVELGTLLLPMIS